MPATGVPDELRRRPVGVFDSGVGGLTVLHELLVRLPHEDFVYLADDARFPFGHRTRDELETFSLEIAEELLARHAKLIVVACNSATAAALPALRRRMLETTLGVDVLGVVQPAAVQAVAATHTGRVGLLATPTTVTSGAYARAIAEIDPFVAVTQVAAPEMTAIVQEGSLFDERAVDVVRGYCEPLIDADVDTVILGSTHYPLVQPVLQRMLGPRVTTIASGRPVARQVEHVLGVRGLAHPRGDLPGPPAQGEYRFLCTGDPDGFRALGTRFLQMPLGEVDRVGLGSAASGARITIARAGT
jgi:glutamate racemase